METMSSFLMITLLISLIFILFISFFIWKLVKNKPAWADTTKPFLWLAMSLFALSMALPAFTTSSDRIAWGGEMLMMGLMYIWVMPWSFFAFPNYLLPIVWWRVSEGKSTFYLEKVSLFLMCSSLMWQAGFGWGYVVWLLSGLCTVAMIRVAKGGQARLAWRWLAMWSVCVIGLLLALGWWQFQHADSFGYEIRTLIHIKNVLFVSPIGWLK